MIEGHGYRIYQPAIGQKIITDGCDKYHHYLFNANQ